MFFIFGLWGIEDPPSLESYGAASPKKPTGVVRPA
jgi:hypothetical protein